MEQQFRTIRTRVGIYILPKVCSKWLQSIMHTVQFINTFTFRFEFIVQIRSYPLKLHVFSHRKRDWLQEQRQYVSHASCIHSPICCFEWTNFSKTVVSRFHQNQLAYSCVLWKVSYLGNCFQYSMVYNGSSFMVSRILQSVCVARMYRQKMSTVLVTGFHIF